MGKYLRKIGERAIRNPFMFIFETCIVLILLAGFVLVMIYEVKTIQMVWGI